MTCKFSEKIAAQGYVPVRLLIFRLHNSKPILPCEKVVYAHRYDAIFVARRGDLITSFIRTIFLNESSTRSSGRFSWTLLASSGMLNADCT